ncbi:hypothetical protein DFP72DRAFT_811871 [Ephemerocybe angulata]|uniref:Uncharacterized protein n=1 Tax=Ephemerocybe angulata TaxID=980116 RepID=A0A8H6HZ62_9AGAR|nr:hypothetical protein DFP72DRAFT_811871 [Tulosesus angulatus]
MIQHTQEFQRTVGFIRMTTGYASLHSQFARNGWQYSTRAGTSKASGGSESISVLSPLSSLTLQHRVCVSSISHARLAHLGLTVPVYDARGLDTLDFNSVLPKLAESLPLYTDGEIPYGSFIVVGYTMTVYRANSGNWTLGNNIKWVIIVGIPEGDSD